MRTTTYIVAVATLITLSFSAVAADWQWQLPAARYQRLNVFERTQYDKAAGLFQRGEYAAAAAEFEKFKVQHADSDEIPYIVFMQARSLHCNNNRNAAIKVYQTVIDTFGTIERYRDEVIASTFWRGMAYIDSGEMTNGLRAMKKMAENPDFKEHVLTAGALRQLADNHFANKEYDQAVKYWQQTIRDFRKLNDVEVRNANSNYIAYTIVSKGYQGYDRFFMSIATEQEKEAENLPVFRANYMEEFYQRAYGLYHWHESWKWRKVWPLDKDPIKHKALVEAEAKAYYEYFRASKTAWEGAGRQWQYYEHCERTLCHTWGTREEREKLTQEAVNWTKTIEDKAQRDQYNAQLIQYLCDARESQLARYVKSQMTDKMYAEFMESFVLQSEGKLREATEVLEGVEAGAKGQMADRALDRRAHLLMHYIGDYDGAIKAFGLMTNPPWNLWQIAECYQRWSGNGSDATKFRQAINQLAEIEGSFPDWAPRAAWHMSSWCAHSGDEAGAIAHARRVMTQYPKSGESSQAHLYLESKGIKMGGGVGEGNK